MRSLKFASLALLLCGCARNPYRKLDAAASMLPDARKLLAEPVISRELYRCAVDGRFLLKKFHLSGILLFKTFDDGSLRVVFQNEMGISFFNFKWDARDSFSVTSAMPQLNKPAVIRTLRTDFELLLRKNIDTAAAKYLQTERTTAVQVPRNSGFAWYSHVTPQIVYGGKFLVTSISMDSAVSAELLPYRILVRHHKARFTIDLTRLPTDEN